ncbi:MAG: zinc-binding dehydrogenase [Bacteroidota bacterium]
MSEMMKSVRQPEAGGNLVIESVPIPEPGPGEVLVKMAASPINPSDLANIAGGYMVRTWPFTPGLEGSGTVVKAGRGLPPALRSGKRVACSPDPGGDGTWAEFMKTSAMHTVPLPVNVDFRQGSMMLINPMTAMALIQLARQGNHKAFVNNAAASALGKMLIRLAAKHSIPLISIVRKDEQVDELKRMGAEHVLNSTSGSFETELRELALQLGATLVLDAVAGDESFRLLTAAPDGSRLVAYARLSGAPLKADPADLIRLEKYISGFQLGNWLKSKSTLAKLHFMNQVKKEMNACLTTHIARTFPLEDVNEAIREYSGNMSGGKILLIQD